MIRLSRFLAGSLVAASFAVSGCSTTSDGSVVMPGLKELDDGLNELTDFSEVTALFSPTKSRNPRADEFPPAPAEARTVSPAASPVPQQRLADARPKARSAAVRKSPRRAQQRQAARAPTATQPAAAATPSVAVTCSEAVQEGGRVKVTCQ